jgi:hypothetical protein
MIKNFKGINYYQTENQETIIYLFIYLFIFIFYLIKI